MTHLNFDPLLKTVLISSFLSFFLKSISKCEDPVLLEKQLTADDVAQQTYQAVLRNLSACIIILCLPLLFSTTDRVTKHMHESWIHYPPMHK